MENIDLSLIISGSVALAAIISPIIVTLLNNWFLIRKYKLEVIEKRSYEKQQYINGIYDDYLNSLGTISTEAFNSFQGLEFLGKYKRPFYLLLNHVDEECMNLMLEMDKLIESGEWKKNNAKTLELIPLIKKSLLEQNY